MKGIAGIFASLCLISSVICGKQTYDLYKDNNEIINQKEEILSEYFADSSLKQEEELYYLSGENELCISNEEVKDEVGDLNQKIEDNSELISSGIYFTGGVGLSGLVVGGLVLTEPSYAANPHLDC